jgi:CRISPR/Cas system-associated exonuclease Cas4 (RecB family)
MQDETGLVTAGEQPQVGGQPQVLSASSISTFMRCEQQWYYAYVEKIRRPPSVRQAIGLAGHAGIAHNMTQKIMSFEDEPLDVVLDVFNDEYDDMALDGLEETETENTAKGKESGLKTLRIAHLEVAPLIQPVMVEQPIQFDVDGVPYSGYIDLVDDKRRVRDSKFVGKKPGGVNVQYATAMTGYAVAMRQLTGEIESEVVLDYFVRTQKPYHLPVASGGPIEDSAIRFFAKLVKDVNRRIQDGVFLPTGLTHQACGWCGYRDICPAYRKAGENGSP